MCKSLHKKLSQFSDSLFALQVKGLQIIGLLRDEDIKNKTFNRMLHFCCLFSITFCFTFEGYFIANYYSDILGSAEAFAPFSSEIITYVKFSTIYFSKEKIYEIMDQLKKMALESDAYGVNVIRKINQIDKFITLSYCLAASLTGVGYLIAPLISNFVRIVVYGLEYDYDMPFKAAYPYNIASSPAYELTYLMFISASHFTVAINVSVRNLSVNQLSIEIYHRSLRTLCFLVAA